jgi:hypothetical protein
MEKYFWQGLPKNAGRIIATLFLRRTSLLGVEKFLFVASKKLSFRMPKMRSQSSRKLL